MFKYFLMLGVCFFAVDIAAQVFLHGKIVDADTERPIPYVNLQIEKTVFGASTNYEGDFEFSVPDSLKYKKLHVYAIGYVSQTVNAFDFIGDKTSIALEPEVYAIHEFVKSAKQLYDDPKLIVTMAVQHLKKNLSYRPYTLHGTFQNTFQDYRQFKIENKSSTTVDVMVEPISKGKVNYVVKENERSGGDNFWDQFRYNEDAKLPQYNVPDFGTNHLSMLLSMDPIRNRGETFDFVKRLRSDFVQNHWFWMDSVAYYNGRTSYFINVFLKPSIRFNYINYVSEPVVKSQGLGDFKLLDESGQGVQLSVGKVIVDVEDLGIAYFEYYNGFLNDRYKFCGEYLRNKDGKYYPSKLYFANKFWMNKSPDFNEPSGNKLKWLSCTHAQKFYEDIVRKYSKSPIQRAAVDSIVDANMIFKYHSPYRYTGFAQCIATSKISEDILSHFELSEYEKFLQHRILRIDSISFKDKSREVEILDPYTDFDRNMYYLGDYNSHVQMYNHYKPNDKTVRDTTGFTRSITAVMYDPTKLNDGELPESPILIPVSSKDEYHYLKPPKTMDQEFDKEYLIKGYIYLVNLKGH